MSDGTETPDSGSDAGPPGGGSGAEPAGAGIARYKVPAIAGAVVAGTAALLILPVALHPGDPFEDVGSCEEVFTGEFVDGLHLGGDLMMLESEPGESGLPARFDPTLICVDAADKSLVAEFFVLDPAEDPTDYGAARDMVSTRRGIAEETRSDADEERPFRTTELEDLDAGDGGFTALYEPPEELRWDYAEWAPGSTRGGHATAVFSLRNVVVQVTWFGGDGSTTPSRASAERVAEDLAERIPETGEEGGGSPPENTVEP
ncbi:hypothetical protein [Nocardiopsis potens]|uniref:hypothetical protein n=1 Tax=Nocardiopsis potens TaxID=1246458 RepID=UPI0003497EBF|nr:hypothetical protein [Nocardiopsis potens]